MSNTHGYTFRLVFQSHPVDPLNLPVLVISDAPIPILISVSVLFWWYRISIGKVTNARY